VSFGQASAESKAEAEALFDRGLELMRQGDFSQSCQLLEQSQRIDPGVGTLLYLGECYEKGGRLASAWATFREATSAARASGQVDRARQGQDRADRLSPRLAKLKIVVDDVNRNIQGIEVKRSGASVSSALWGVPAPVDPGDHVIIVSAPGFETYTQTVNVKGEGAVVEVKVPALVESTAQPAPAPTSGEPTGEPAPGGATPPADSGAVEVSDGSGQRTVGYIVSGVGVLGLGLGGYFGLRAINKNSDAERECPRGDRCDTQLGVTFTEEAQDAAVVSNVAFAAGGALLATGIVLLLTAPSSAESPPATAWTIAPPLGNSPGGVFVRGSF
jgi:hypothetical protein